jgi:hypothetical protein
MTNSKMFTIAGTSVLNGQLTYRFATGNVKVRVNKLIKTGHSDINLQTLPAPMTKSDAVSFLQSQGIDAVLPSGGKHKAVPTTAEQSAAAEKAAKAAAFTQRMAAARAAKAAAKQAAEDAAFFAAQSGDTAGAAALLAAAEEHGVEIEREMAIAEGTVEG